jgi:hypothetical protein
MDPNSTPVLQPNIRNLILFVFGSPMPVEEALTTSSTEVTEADGNVVCLSTEDGSFGSTIGDHVQLFFNYQVETIPGTTETQLNEFILGDIKITMVDFMLPVLFSECRAPTPASGVVENPEQNPGKFVGLVANPADFVLRGCELSFYCLGAEESAILT